MRKGGPVPFNEERVMSFRNLNPQEIFIQMTRVHRPKYRFGGGDPVAFAAWKKRALSVVLATLGDFPQRVAAELRLLVEWEGNGQRRQKWPIDIAPLISATLLCQPPADAVWRQSAGDSLLPWAQALWQGHDQKHLKGV